jgi:hypothetical protein
MGWIRLLLHAPMENDRHPANDRRAVARHRTLFALDGHSVAIAAEQRPAPQEVILAE